MVFQIRTLFIALLAVSAVVIIFYGANYTRNNNCLYERNLDPYFFDDVESLVRQPGLRTTPTTVPPAKNRQAKEPKIRAKTKLTRRKRRTDKKCQRVDHILFLKTHKTGGSTITNILNRYADKWNLTVVLPYQKHLFTFLWPTRFRLTYTAPLHKIEANILCNHARYNRKPMHWMFPKSKSKYISILRDPVLQYESTFNFMHFANPLGFNEEVDPLGTFLKYPPSFKDTKPFMKKTLALHLLRNPMMFDLGFDFKYFQNATAVDRYLTFLDSEFDLVMIMEHFDESLVLLKRLMCWTYEDILFFKLNERQEKHKRKSLDEDVKENIRSWNKADTLLYDHFNKTLWAKIRQQGRAFQRELKIFRHINSRLSKQCLEKGDFLDEAYTGVYVKGYSLREDIPDALKRRCESMKRNEISYVKYFRKKMTERIMGIEEPDEYLDDPLNDWDTASDYEHAPVLSGFGSGEFSTSGRAHKEVR